MKLSLSRLRASDAPWVDDSLESVMQTIAKELHAGDAVIEMIIVDDPFIRNINREYRGKDRATNVITFSYLSTPDETDIVEPPDADTSAGEIYISYETLEREANEKGVEPGSLFLRLGVHGLLHVVGHVHDNDDEAQRMEREERRILQDHLTPREIEALI